MTPLPAVRATANSPAKGSWIIDTLRPHMEIVVGRSLDRFQPAERVDVIARLRVSYPKLSRAFLRQALSR